MGKAQKNIDGGYAWIILLAAFPMQIMMMMSTLGGMGAMFVELAIRYPDSSKAAISVLITIQICTMGVCGYLLGPWVTKIGCRRLSMTGGLLLSLGFLLSAFATNLFTLYITFGIMTGMGTTAMQIPSLAMTQQYFVKRRSFVMGMLTTGMAIGTLISAPLIIRLVREYSLSGLFIIYACIMLQSVWLGALFKPLTPQQPDVENEFMKDKEVSLNESNDHFENRFKQIDHTNKDVMLRSGEKLNSPSNDIVKGEPSVPLKGRLMTLLGLGTCQNPAYGVYLIGLFLKYQGHMVWLAFLLPMGVTLGLAEKDAAYMMTIVGIVTIPSRFIAGFLGDLFPQKRRYFLPVAASLAGVVTAFVPIMAHNFTSLAIISAIFGALSGFYMVWFMTTAMDLFGLATFICFAGHVYLVLSITVIITNSVSAYLLDLTGSLDYAFHTFGAAQTLGGVIWVISILMARGQRKRKCLNNK